MLRCSIRIEQQLWFCGIFCQLKTVGASGHRNAAAPLKDVTSAAQSAGEVCRINATEK
jgi:hypothetical protein